MWIQIWITDTDCPTGTPTNDHGTKQCGCHKTQRIQIIKKRKKKEVIQIKCFENSESKKMTFSWKDHRGGASSRGLKNSGLRTCRKRTVGTTGRVATAREAKMCSEEQRRKGRVGREGKVTAQPGRAWGGRLRRHLPCGLVVRTPCCHCVGHRFDPGSRN